MQVWLAHPAFLLESAICFVSVTPVLGSTKDCCTQLAEAVVRLHDQNAITACRALQ